MAANSVPFARISPLIYRLVGPTRGAVLHSDHPTRISATSIKLREFRSCSLFSSHSSRLSHSHGTVYKDLSCPGIGLGQILSDRFLLSAVSDGVSDGAGGHGGSGDGDSGGRSEGGGSDGEHNWSLLSWYLTLLARYPVSIKALTSAFLTLIGDLICQIWIDQMPSLDLKRTFLFTLLGLILVGPTLHFWYLYLSKVVTLPGASGAFLRLLLDQFLFSPIFIGVFLSTLMTLEGRASQVVSKLQQEWISAVLVNWQLWIPFQFVNFRFVPQQFQVLAANVVALIWNVILSFKAHKEVLPK
ncbi:hypothetical protein FNV43_RR16111 [Rhamnella rubrinervis]|uniref:Uncharacterized protein n=1 Tax=Rhamnella rubrinervis TaxID=2594499 RepID=A0A8K0GYG0_9ROSA|nr:hypothetical protein FNV43_RR16111 [Rhamnella rubrinervis]